jgi:hypothetical protein
VVDRKAAILSNIHSSKLHNVNKHTHMLQNIQRLSFFSILKLSTTWKPLSKVNFYLPWTVESEAAFGKLLRFVDSLVGLEYKTSIYQTNTSTTNHLAQLDILAYCNARWHRLEVEADMALRARFQLPLFLVLVLRPPRALERRRSRALVSRHCTNTTRTLGLSNCSQYHRTIKWLILI